MKGSSERAIIIILIVVVVVLSLLLIQSQNTINSQRVAIASQEQQIGDLKAENAKLSEISPEKLIEDAKTLVKEQGTDLLNTLIRRIQQEQ